MRPARGPSGPSLRELELEAEVARLQAELDARPATPPAMPPAPVAGPGDSERALVAALAGSGANIDALLADPALAARVTAVARALMEFAELLGRAFLGATTDADRTMAGRVRGLAADVVRGRADLELLADALEEHLATDRWPGDRVPGGVRSRGPRSAAPDRPRRPRGGSRAREHPGSVVASSSTRNAGTCCHGATRRCARATSCSRPTSTVHIAARCSARPSAGQPGASEALRDRPATGPRHACSPQAVSRRPAAASSAAKPEPPPPLIYSLCLTAGQQLNWYNDTANTLYVRIYQLSAPDTFMQTDPARMVEPGFTLPGAEGGADREDALPGQQKPRSRSASSPTPPPSVWSRSTTRPPDR